MSKLRPMALIALTALIFFAAAGQAMAGNPRVKLLDNGGLTLDDKPYLPIFVWAQPSSTIELHKSLGMNALHPGEKVENDPTKDYLDKLHKAGMLGLLNVEMFKPELKDHPAVLAWSVEHEPDMPQPGGYAPDLEGDARIIWIEGEAADKSTFTPSVWLDKERPHLSGRKWLTAEKDGKGEAAYNFKSPEAGEYSLWVREFSKSWANPTRWKLNDGQWQETPRTLQAQDNVNLGGGQGVGWSNYGKVTLKEGDNTLLLQIVPGRTVGKADQEPNPEAIWAVDALAFTTADRFPPAKNIEPQPKRLPEIQKNHYQELKKADPTALAWNILTAGFYGGYNKLPMRYYDEFIKWTDIVSFDHYPITGWNQPGRLPEVGLATAKLVALTPKGKPVWTIVEASDQDLSWTAPETRGPNAAEMRAEVFSAIASGAKGIGYFTIAFDPFRWNNLTDEIKEELKRTNADLTALAGPIVMGDTDAKLTVSGDETDDKSADGRAIQAIVKRYEGKTYVIAVNVTRKQVEPAFKIEGLKADAAVVYKEDRSLKIADSSFKDTFAPLAVHIYQMD